MFKISVNQFKKFLESWVEAQSELKIKNYTKTVSMESVWFEHI